jgi:hypothetical protein
MCSKLTTLSLGAFMTITPLSLTLGNEGTTRGTAPPASVPALPLPAVPHLETLQWLSSDPKFREWPNVDIHLGSAPDKLRPFLLDPKPSPPQFSSNAGK